MVFELLIGLDEKLDEHRMHCVLLDSPPGRGGDSVSPAR